MPFSIKLNKMVDKVTLSANAENDNPALIIVDATTPINLFINIPPFKILNNFNLCNLNH